MEGILGLVVLIADIYAVVKIVQSGVPGLHKLLWVLLVVLLPVLGLIAWYLMGPGGRSG